MMIFFGDVNTLGFDDGLCLGLALMGVVLMAVLIALKANQ